jgi:hypothetical protein
MTDQAIDRMKQAVRENRRGKIAVATFWAHEGAIPELALLRARMEVCERIAHDTRHAVWFIGYAPEFADRSSGSARRNTRPSSRVATMAP